MSAIRDGAALMKCTRLLYDAAEGANIPLEVFREAIVVQYRAFKLTDTEIVAAIEKRCDEVDKEAGPVIARMKTMDDGVLSALASLTDPKVN